MRQHAAVSLRSHAAILASTLALACAVGCHATLAKESPVSQSDPSEQIRNAVAKDSRIPAKEIQVKLLADANVPNCTVFTASQRPTGGGRGVYNTGVVTATGVELNTQKAIAQVIHAWGYGEKRTVPAAKVAEVIGTLEGAFVQASTAPILVQQAIDVVGPKQRAQVFLPRETTVDGKPAVEYWVSSPEPPLWLTTLVVAADGTVTLGSKTVW